MRLAVLALSLLLAACGGGGDRVPEPEPEPPPPADACAIAAQRQSLGEYMREQYLWNAQMPAADAAADGMDAYFASMLFKPVDRYSHTLSSASYNQVYRFGMRIGYGYALDWDGERLRVRYVEPMSPSAAAGLRRGDVVLAIDGLDPQQILGGLLPPVTQEGVVRRFRVAGPQGAEREFEVTSAEFSLRPLPTATVLDAQAADGSPIKVGYLVLHQFVNHAQLALNLAADSLATAGVSEVIVDLRYNGGGSIFFSQQLASFLASSVAANELYTGLRYNAGQQARNVDHRILARSSLTMTPLPPMKRVVVIASGSSASASELLINGLRPWIPVVLVGERTYGKPYGSSARDHCGTVYQAMQFEAINALGEGGFTSGFAPDCQVADDLDKELGDPRERRLAAALEYIRSGSCPAQPQSFALKRAPFAPVPMPRLDETPPPGMFAD